MENVVHTLGQSVASPWCGCRAPWWAGRGWVGNHGVIDIGNVKIEGLVEAL